MHIHVILVSFKMYRQDYFAVLNIVINVITTDASHVVSFGIAIMTQLIKSIIVPARLIITIIQISKIVVV